jgi:hypothetical protein
LNAPVTPFVPSNEATRGSKRKATAAPPLSSTEDSLEFELLTHVLQPDKKTKVGNKSKMVKVDTLKFGPRRVSVNIAWEEFQDVVAKEVLCNAPQLAINSFEWHYSKPQNSPWVPVNSEHGWESLVKQVTAKIAKDPSSYVILRMQPPAIVRAPAMVIFTDNQNMYLN